jgi:hypothetical protein
MNIYLVYPIYIVLELESGSMFFVPSQAKRIPFCTAKATDCVGIPANILP